MVSLFSRLAFSLATANNNQLQRAAVLRVSLDPFLPLPRTSSSPTSSSLCRSIYLRSRILGVHTRVYVCVRARSLATVSPFLPSPSFEGYVRFHTNASVVVYKFFSTPYLYVFHASLNFFFTCFLFFPSIIILTLKF